MVRCPRLRNQSPSPSGRSRRRSPCSGDAAEAQILFAGDRDSGSLSGGQNQIVLGIQKMETLSKAGEQGWTLEAPNQVQCFHRIS